MSVSFFEKPILNSPYAYPGRHWVLDEDGQPTSAIADMRRRCALITPVPKPKKQKGKGKASQAELALGADDGISTAEQQYDPTSIINEIRSHVDDWRRLPPSQWQVTPETARLLQHWRALQQRDGGIRPFFCQTEAVETAIWLTEVAGRSGASPQLRRFRTYIESANNSANPELLRLALKLATGAGKTTVMAMIIAWQTVNAVRHPGSKRFSDGFLIVTPGITIRDRLRVLLPNDPDSYYSTRELVPGDMLRDIARAKIVITNYHAFQRRERNAISAGGRALLKGRHSTRELDTRENEGEMLRRVMPELMGMKNIVVLNDEAHHCYREKPGEDDDLKGEEKQEAERNNIAARLWINGLETVKRKLGLAAVYDLSATPFFLSGSGYAEGTLFPWTVSDFSLMDAIECGIVKLPRVPVADDISTEEMPKFRDLWKHIAKRMPKKGRGKAGTLDPLSLPTELQTALHALYGHYEKTFEEWDKAGIEVPPVFIVVCNNTSTSKLVHDFISGFHREEDDGKQTFHEGRLALFRNHDEHGGRLGQLKRIAKQWMDGGYLVCKGRTKPAQLLYRELADMACERIKAAITETLVGERPIKATLDAYNPLGSTRHVSFTTSKTVYKTDPGRCHVNWVVCDSDWEEKFAQVVEAHPRVLAYVKNQGLGLEVPYLHGSVPRRYLPDFIVRIDDGHGPDDPLNIVVEVKGYRQEDAKDKANTMRAYWVPGVNNLGQYGRWAFAEFTSVWDFRDDFEKLVDTVVDAAEAA